MVSDSNPDSISVLSYGGQGSGGRRLESSYTFADTNSNIQIQGIDATNVTLASGEQAIVVCSPFVGSGQAQVKAWLLTGNSGGRAVTITLIEPEHLFSRNLEHDRRGGRGKLPWHRRRGRDQHPIDIANIGRV
jgi:hypothetical protein